MSYQRVLPRDLFNESKLLKCIGKVCTMIHDGIAPEGLNIYEESEDGFIVHQDFTDGSISILNIYFSINGDILNLSTQLNSRLPYPLQYEYDNCGGMVFNNKGEFSEEFLELFETDE